MLTLYVSQYFTMLKMQRIISSFLKINKSSAFNRLLSATNSCFCDSLAKADKQFCLEPIKCGPYTLKRHNNVKRQRYYEFGLYVAACMPKFVQKVQMKHTDELEILVAPEGLFPVLSFMRNHHNACYNHAPCVTAIDVPSRVYRFEVVYVIRSHRYASTAQVKTYTDELTPLHSAYELYLGVNWYEREVYDMFGIIFSHHPDLRRLLTDYGFTGHPLRKDFPAAGYVEVRYDDELKKIVYEPVEFAQEYRSFQLESPWTYYRNFHEGYNSPKPPPK